MIKNRPAAMRGLTLIEAVIVLSIAAMLTAGVWAAAASAINNYKKSDLAKQTTVIINNVRNVYGPRTSFAGLTNISAIQAGIFPPSMIVNAVDGTVHNAFNGNVKFTDALATDTVANLTLSGFTTDVCTDLVLKLNGSITSPAGMQRAGLSTLTINSSPVNFTSGHTLSPKDVVSACNLQDNTNSVTFGIALK